MDYLENWKRPEDLIGKIFTQPQTLYAHNTYQVNNYNNFELDFFLNRTKQNTASSNFLLIAGQLMTVERKRQSHYQSSCNAYQYIG